MKRKWFALTLVLAAALWGGTGCGKKTDGVATDLVEQSFRDAPEDQLNAVLSASTAIKGGDYAGALALLRPLTSQSTLTPMQQESLRDLMLHLQTLANGVTNTASEPNAAPGSKAVGSPSNPNPK